MSTGLSKVKQSHGSMSRLDTSDITLTNSIDNQSLIKQSLPKEVAKVLAKITLSGVAGATIFAVALGLEKATISLFSSENIMASPILFRMHVEVTNWKFHVMGGCILGIFLGGCYFSKQLYDQIGKKSLSSERVIVVTPAINQK